MLLTLTHVIELRGCEHALIDDISAVTVFVSGIKVCFLSASCVVSTPSLAASCRTTCWRSRGSADRVPRRGTTTSSTDCAPAPLRTSGRSSTSARRTRSGYCSLIGWLPPAACVQFDKPAGWYCRLRCSWTRIVNSSCSQCTPGCLYPWQQLSHLLLASVQSEALKGQFSPKSKIRILNKRGEKLREIVSKYSEKNKTSLLNEDAF